MPCRFVRPVLGNRCVTLRWSRPDCPRCGSAATDEAERAESDRDHLSASERGAPIANPLLDVMRPLKSRDETRTSPSSCASTAARPVRSRQHPLGASRAGRPGSHHGCGRVTAAMVSSSSVFRHAALKLTSALSCEKGESGETPTCRGDNLRPMGL